MTREEAIERWIKPACKNTWNEKKCKEIFEALEQEPCEDAISRAEAILQIQRHGVGCFDPDEFSPEQAERFVINMLNELPSVNPQYTEDEIQKMQDLEQAEIEKAYELGKAVQPKTGHWIIIDDCELFMAKCSECGEVVDSRMISKYPYCHCGARMVEPQESEIQK